MSAQPHLKFSGFYLELLLTKIVNVHVMIKKLHFKGPGIFHYLSDARNFYFLVYGACSKLGKHKALCAIASNYMYI